MQQRAQVVEHRSADADESDAVGVYAAVLRTVFETDEAPKVDTLVDDDGILVTLTTRVPRELYEDADRLIDREMAVHQLVAQRDPDAAGRVALEFTPV